MSQSRRIPETERAKYRRDPPDIHIHKMFRISDVSSGGVTSDQIEVGGMKWVIHIDKRLLDKKKFLFLRVFPQHFDSLPWIIELTAEFILIRDSDHGKNVSQMHHYVLRDLAYLFKNGCYLIQWDEMVEKKKDEKKGFVVNEQIEVMIRLSIMHGLRCNPSFDFSSSGDIRSDVVLMIEGKPVHVNKEYLGLHSPVFQTMFFGYSPEKGKDEIELEDVDYEDFIKLLHVIYPCQRNITETNAEGLIKLAQQFKISSVIERAEDALIESFVVKPEERIQIGDKYQLFRLLEHGLSQIDYVEDAYAVREDPCFKNLSEATKIVLLEKLVLAIPAKGVKMFQPRLIPEIERAKYTRNPPDGSIEEHFRIIGFDDALESDAVRIGGLDWKLGVNKELVDEKEYLSVSIIPPYLKSPPWNIELTAEFILRHNTDPNKNVSQMSRCFVRGFTDRRYVSFSKPQGCYLMQWDEMMDEKNGYIENEEISVEIRLSILKGLSCNPVFDFSSAGNNNSDVVLIVEGKPVHVNKQYLGLYSPFFEAMFFGDFAEKDKNKIELKDVDYEEFIELLHVIYPSQKSITGRSAEYLIELADRFQITSVIHRSANVLISSKNRNPTEKIRIADQYKLYKLMEHCLSAFYSLEKIQAIKDDPIYEGLSETTKAALLEIELKVTKEAI